MQFTKKQIKRITLFTIIALILVAIFSSSVYAGDTLIDNALDGIAGVVFFPVKFIPLIIGKLLEVILLLFKVNSMEDILFNRVDILNVNFFDFSVSDTALKIHQGVAVWYTSLRNIAIIGLAVIVIYVGIRMAYTTIAEEKAKYKQMLQSWIEGVALVFIMHLVIALTIALNNALVGLLDPHGVNSDIAGQFIDGSLNSIGFTSGVGNAVAYVVIEGITMVFTITYIARMVRVAFLIIIAPLVCLTYSIDKLGDNKSQALNTWFKEFFFSVLIQPFHCVIYCALGSISVKLMSSTSAEPDLGNALIAIVMLAFIFEGEKIVKHIFKLNPQSSQDAIKDAAVWTALLGQTSDGRGKIGILAGNAIEDHQVKSNSVDLSDDDEVNRKRQETLDLIAERKAELARMQENSLERSQAEEEIEEEIAEQEAELREVIRNRRKTLSTKQKSKLRRAGEFYAETTGRMGLAATGAGLLTGLGGGLEGAYLYGHKGWDTGAELGAIVRGKLREDRLNDAYEDYLAMNEGISEEDARRDALDLMSGTKLAITTEEKELRDSMLAMRNSYLYDGMKEGDLNKELNENLKKFVKRSPEENQNIRETKFSDAFTRYKNKNSGKTMEEVRKDAVDLMTGKKTAHTSEERELRDSMLGLRNALTAGGVKGDSLNKEMMRTMTKLESRLISSGKVKPNIHTSKDTSRPNLHPTNNTK